ncbi:MAG: alpha/beta hydrolase [Lachnospiraceae bacterium]|nr:alpha/beta hydrolase [Lachnospiraceae bacterium]
MCLGFSYIGLIWLIMLLVPNFIWTKNKPKDYEEYVHHENKVLRFFERAGQFIVTPVALIFYDFNFKGWNFWCPVLIVSFLCMVLYEIFWIRYFKSEKTMEDFYRGIIGIPVAGATLPVIAFFLLGIYGGNGIMIIGSIILGIGHIGIHLAHRKEVCEPKPKRHIVRRILVGVPKVIVSLILIVVLGFFVVAIIGRNINQIKRAFDYKNGINKSEYVMLNGQEQYILTMGHDTSNPVIISLHGGPGSPSTCMDYCWLDYLTDEYTVICWDQRGCGRTYYHNVKTDPENSTVSFDQAEEDLDALVDYACNTYGQNKVIIMGHSYGSLLGSQYALDHPEKISHYIGIGQEVKEKGLYAYTYTYEDALAKAKEAGDDTSEMEKAYKNLMNNPTVTNMSALDSFTSKYHPVTETADASTVPTIFSPYIGIDDVRWYITLLSAMNDDSRYEELEAPLINHLMDFDAYKRSTDFQVPVFFISGSDDWSCPVEPIDEYLGVITAPKKDMYLVDGCGHSPQAQLPKEFCQVIKSFLGQ